MSHSTSSLNCFANCMAKYEHQYILHTQPCKPPSPHLLFGSMAHEVLEKAGKLRDMTEDGVIDKEEYVQVIPSEILYLDLKNEFNINSWNRYFMPIIRQTAEYERKLIAELKENTGEDVVVEREVKLQLTPEELHKMGYTHIKQPFVGVIDLLLYTKTAAIILDYKFSSSVKTQDDFDMNSQLPGYAMLVHLNYDIPLHNIQYGYIDIPKKCFGTPTVLTSGKLSRSKDQNVSQEMYEKAVIAIHGEDDEYYNCKPGGYYYDCWCNMALNKPAYLSYQYLDFEVYEHVMKDMLTAANVVELFKDEHIPFLKKYDAYTCKGCEFLKACKPWTSEV